MKYITGRRKQTGATLMVVIISMVVVAALGVALYTLTSTSLLNQLVAQRAPKALYLAESGIRIAAAEYKTAYLSDNVNAILCALHNKTLTLPDKVSTVKIGLYPLWFYATAADVNDSASETLYLHLPGGAPEDDNGTLIIPTTGLLRVKDEGRVPSWNGPTSTQYTIANVGAFDAGSGGTRVTFTLDPAFQDDIIVADEFYLCYAEYTTAQPATSAGNDLILNVTDIKTAKIFPAQNASFSVVKGNSFYYYKYDFRIINTTANTVKLTNLQPVATLDALFPLNIIFGDQVIMSRTLSFSSDSRYGD